MHLEKVVLKNFRSFADAAICFAKDLTVLAGENNAGKSNVLDALRLVLSSADNRQRLFPDEDDLRNGEQSFTIQTVFDELTDDQKGLFITAIGDITDGRAYYGYRFTKPEKNVRFHRPEQWAGPREGAEPEPEARQLIRHVYLPALRDAQGQLASSRSERISFLLRHCENAGERSVDSLIELAKESVSPVNKHPLIKNASDRISDDLELITRGVRKHRAELRLATPDLRSLARDLRLHVLERGLDLVELSRCGLGYANLLYIACVLVELKAAADADLTVFLVEEPEAHLHPQLQAVLLAYLRDKAVESRKTQKPIGVPEGRIQVVVATHSPNLTASVPIEQIVVLRQSSEAFSPPAAASEPSPHQAIPRSGASSAAIPIAQLDITEEHRSKITRYLDVTRASLLFSSRILLVEGISEALVLPTIAEHCLFTAVSERTALDRFRGSSLIAIDGVDFEPYIRLLLQEFQGRRIADLVVVLTDSDDGARINRLRGLGAELDATSLLEIVEVPDTLEAALYDAGNEALLRGVFMSLRPNLAEAFDEVVRLEPERERGRAYAGLIKEKRIRKGDHAQLLAEKIAAKAPFKVPECLEKAIRRIAGSESQA